MKVGPVNGHGFAWQGNRLKCKICKKSAEVQRYWLSIIQKPCTGLKREGDELQKEQLARKIGAEELEGEGPWVDPYTGHHVKLGEGGWDCVNCGLHIDFGTKAKRLRLGNRQKKCAAGGFIDPVRDEEGEGHEARGRAKRDMDRETACRQEG